MQKIGNYNIIKRIARGGMGEVFLGVDTRNNEKVAVKVLRKLTDSARKRFLQEVSAQSRLHHENIVRILNVGVYEAEEEYGKVVKNLYIAMEYIEGDNLAKIVADRQVQEKHALKITRAIAHALKYIHENRIIHRDIKPSNILIDSHSRKVKLTDFGIAKILGEHGMTITGQSFGTPHYIAPEQINDAKNVEASADMYSLGSILYLLLAGKPPYSGTSTMQILMSKVQGALPRSIESYCPNLAPRTVEILSKLMSIDAANRYQNAQAVIQDIDTHLPSVAGNSTRYDPSPASDTPSGEFTVGTIAAAAPPVSETMIREHTPASGLKLKSAPNVVTSVRKNSVDRLEKIEKKVDQLEEKLLAHFQSLDAKLERIIRRLGG